MKMVHQDLQIFLRTCQSQHLYLIGHFDEMPRIVACAKYNNTLLSIYHII